MKNYKIIFILLFIFNTFFIFSHRHGLFLPPPPYPWIHYHPQTVIVITDTTYVHRLGKVYIDNDLSTDNSDIESIDFYYWLDSNYEKALYEKVNFTIDGYANIEKYLIDSLEKKDIPDRQLTFGNLRSFSFTDDNLLNLNFSDDNSYSIMKYYGEDYYLYNLNFSLLTPINDSIKSGFDKLNDNDFELELDKFLYRKQNMRIVGISVFSTGMGLFGTLNIAGLITTAIAMNDHSFPRAVPISLFVSAFGSLSLSIGLGIPLWASSYSRKVYTVKFHE